MGIRLKFMQGSLTESQFNGVKSGDIIKRVYTDVISFALYQHSSTRA